MVALLVTALMFDAVLAEAAGLSSGNHVITQDVLPGGGGSLSSARHRVTQSLGQSSAIGPSASSGHRNYGGFWNPSLCPRGDADGSGAVNILDAVYALRILLGLEPPPAVLCTADADSSGGVDISDLIRIMRKSIGEPT